MSYLDIPTIYVAHPLSGDIAGNSARALRWLRWLMASEPDAAFCLPWLAFVEVGPGSNPDADPGYRARCLRDDLAIAARCSGIALCGGRISPGMAAEAEACTRAGGILVDLTGMGDEPPAEARTVIGPVPWRKLTTRT